MTSPIYKKINNKQDGVTLLLAILILSSLMAISFSLATILLVEVRTSGDLLRTEGAFYGSQAVIEQALFNYKRRLPNGSLTYLSKVGGIKVSTPVVSDISDPVQQDIVKPGQTFVSSINRYALYNHLDKNSSGSGYGGIKIRYLDTGNNYDLQVYICQYDSTQSYETTACTNPSDSAVPSYWLVNPSGSYGNLSPGESLVNPLNSAFPFSLDPTNLQEIVLVNPSTSPMYVQIEAFDGSNNPLGIPFFNETSVDISASNAGVTRKIRTYIPSN